MVVACLVGGYFPPPASVSWSPTSGSALTFPAARRPDGRYVLASTRPLGPDEHDPLRCTAHHPASGDTRSVDVTVAAVAVPHVSLFHSCTEAAVVQLVCLVSGFAPPPVKVEWLEDGHALSHAPLAALVQRDVASNTFSTSARLNVTLDAWRQWSYACRVTHPATYSVQEAVGHKCLGSTSDTSGIQVFVLPPSPADLFVSQRPALLCLVSSLPSDEGLTVSWTRKQGGSLQPHPLQLQAQFNGTFTATSRLPIAPRDWTEGDAFTCTVHHADLPSPRTHTITHPPGKLLTPRVYVLRPPEGELSASPPLQFLSLTCLVRGFYPADISLEWQKNQETVDPSSYHTMSPVREQAGGSQHSYFLYSRLEVPRKEWLTGVAFTCMVVHEALPLQFIQRSISQGTAPPDFTLPEDLCHDDPEASNGPWDTIAVFITLFLLSVCYSATVTLFKVKWLLSTVIHLKQGPAPDYKNVIQRVV